MKKGKLIAITGTVSGVIFILLSRFLNDLSAGEKNIHSIILCSNAV